MKALTSITIILTMLIGSTAYGCDEACKKEEAQKANNIKFAGYLSWRFCDDTRMQFMTSAIDSLENYRSNHFDTRYKGGMRNIKNFVVQRKEWLKECDQYYRLTDKGRVFDDDKTTKQIFEAMDSVSSELGALISGVTYSAEAGQDSTSSELDSRFNNLFKLVDDHKTLMHLKGKYVVR